MKKNPYGLNTNKAVVCIIGTLRALGITYRNIINNVIRPLDADLIICVSRISENDEALLKYFRKIKIIDMYIYEDGVKYEDLCRKFGKSFDRDRWLKYAEIRGNWLGGLDDRKGSGLYLTYNYSKLIERLRGLRAEGSSYDRYIITRSDFLWTSEHPPLKFLDADLVWIPEGQDWWGYNDRHAICSKNNITQYLSMFEYMMDSRATKYLNGQEHVTHEKHLKRHLNSTMVKVGRFKNVAYLTGSPNEHTRWKAPIKVDLEGKTYTCKYKNELIDAVRNAEKLGKHKDWNEMIFPKSGEK